MPHGPTKIKVTDALPAPSDALLSAQEAAEWLGVSIGLLSRSSIPKVKLNRRTLYRPSDLRAYVSARVTHEIGGAR